MEEIKIRYYSNSALYGEAVNYTYIKKDGTMWLGNDEYETQVNFCPFTGWAAPVQMILVESGNRKNDNEHFKRYK